jgi:hypothetical protein
LCCDASRFVVEAAEGDDTGVAVFGSIGGGVSREAGRIALLAMLAVRSDFVVN